MVHRYALWMQRPLFAAGLLLVLLTGVALLAVPPLQADAPHPHGSVATPTRHKRTVSPKRNVTTSTRRIRHSAERAQKTEQPSSTSAQPTEPILVPKSVFSAAPKDQSPVIEGDPVVQSLKDRRGRPRLRGSLSNKRTVPRPFRSQALQSGATGNQLSGNGSDPNRRPVDTHCTEVRFPPTVRFSLYNNGRQELDLWNLEARRFIRSPVVVSPRCDAMVYSEVFFTAHNRQTYSRLYWVDIPQGPVPGARSDVYSFPVDPYQKRLQQSQQVVLPNARSTEKAATTKPTETIAKTTIDLEAEPPLGRNEAPPLKPDDRVYTTFLDPDLTLQLRQQLSGVGEARSHHSAFNTLTVVDWSASGQRLLFKEKSGALHIGLRTSDILIFDRQRGTVSIYPDVRRAIAYQVERYHPATPTLKPYEFEIQPLGWEANSDSRLLIQAWQLFPPRQDDAPPAKTFLGVWVYDIDQRRLQLFNTHPDTATVVSNGRVPQLSPPPPAPKPSKARRWYRPLS
ncbi:MAG: hypothetical protein SFZ03_02180 [Candidatus Melainabacteria bacterium]|nr:hypothetical protein [Candidatus Melainabacteria bacterium]